jgi:hypothetical protein
MRNSWMAGPAITARAAVALFSLIASSQSTPRAQDNAWPGKKRLLAIADPQEWYSSSGYHHGSASHTLATIERLGRETGDWITIIRTDMRLLTKERPEGHNVRILSDFDAIFYMGEVLGILAASRRPTYFPLFAMERVLLRDTPEMAGISCCGPEYAQMIGGNLVGEFPSANMPIIVEDSHFPGMDGSPQNLSSKISTPSSGQTTHVTWIT